jgi:hypothetical protein
MNDSDGKQVSRQSEFATHCVRRTGSLSRAVGFRYEDSRQAGCAERRVGIAPKSARYWGTIVRQGRF